MWKKQLGPALTGWLQQLSNTGTHTESADVE